MDIQSILFVVYFPAYFVFKINVWQYLVDEVKGMAWGRVRFGKMRSEHSGLSVVYGFVSLDYGLGTEFPAITNTDIERFDR